MAHSLSKKVLTYLFVLCVAVLALSISRPVPDYKLIVFEGSDWCANCRRLEKQILSKDELKQFLKKQSVEVEKIDFPQRKKLPKAQITYNESVAEKYGFEGVYPTVLLLKTSSDKYVKLTQYTNQSVSEYCRMISEQLQALE